jgi:hypothetical protein
MPTTVRYIKTDWLRFYRDRVANEYTSSKQLSQPRCDAKMENNIDRPNKQLQTLYTKTKNHMITVRAYVCIRIRNGIIPPHKRV